MFHKHAKENKLPKGKLEMTSASSIISRFTAGLMLTALAGCNTSTNAVDKSSSAGVEGVKVESTEQTAQSSNDSSQGEDASTENTEPAVEEEVEVAKIINRPGKVANKGTYVRIIVNNAPITNFDIQRRTAFLKLRRVNGDRTKKAEDELINESLKNAEAIRVNTRGSDARVKDAFATFAKRNGASPSQLAKELDRMGVGAEHFKEFIRTQMSWQGVVSSKFQAETRQLSQIDAVTQIRKSGSEKPQLAEYSLQQVVFVVPEARRKAILKLRRDEAKAFRQRFTGCPQTLNLVKTLKDVSVIEKRRVLGPEIPPGWKAEIEALSAGQTTKVKDTPNGVEFFAVCNIEMVSDDRAAQIATQSKEFESFNDKGSAVSEEHLNQLRSKAIIIYR